MAVFKCKMCGGSLEVQEGQNTCICEYCGTEQTLPKLDSEKKANLYDRANHFRRNNDYDKAAGIYEQILNEDSTDAEAYWSLVLCRYGIKYVEDPGTHKRIPTVNRAQYTSIYADEDYKAAIEHADMTQKSVYEREAAAIDEIQRGILTISEKESPYDVFICYKETDEAGRRTQDSVLANDLYHQLVQEGFKVFFAKITLEDKLGQEYEPYIFAALNSAKVMVVLGTKPEYFKAVWVKNEWSRFLALVKASNGKKILIPTYKDMDPYDLPEEFSHLQAQDMSKLGFMQDLIRGIKKLTDIDFERTTQMTKAIHVTGNNSNVNTLLNRGRIAIEDHEWHKADQFYEEVLNQDSECADAYIGKCLAENKCENIGQMAERFQHLAIEFANKVSRVEAFSIDESHIDEKVKLYAIKCYLSEEEIRKAYGDFDTTYQPELKKQEKYLEIIERNIANDRLWNRAFKYAKEPLRSQMEAVIQRVRDEARSRFEMADKKDEESKQRIITEYEEHLARADREVERLRKEAEKAREEDYQKVSRESKSCTSNSYQIRNQYPQVMQVLETLNDYKDCKELAENCKKEYDEYFRKKEIYERSCKNLEAHRLEKEAFKQLNTLGDFENAKGMIKAFKKRNLVRNIVKSVIGMLVLITFLPWINDTLYENVKYIEAVELSENGDHQAAQNILRYLHSEKAKKLFEYESAILTFEYYELYEKALEKFKKMPDYRDSNDYIKKIEALLEQNE